jgi:hypothetical protein
MKFYITILILTLLLEVILLFFKKKSIAHKAKSFLIKHTIIKSIGSSLFLSLLLIPTSNGTMILTFFGYVIFNNEYDKMVYEKREKLNDDYFSVILNILGLAITLSIFMIFQTDIYTYINDVELERTMKKILNIRSYSIIMFMIITVLYVKIIEIKKQLKAK